MKIIEVDDALYRYIASHTQDIGESASDILRRMLNFTESHDDATLPSSTSDDKAEINVERTETQISILSADPVEAIQDLLFSGEFAIQTKVVNRFMMILTALYRLNSASFAKATAEFGGRKRIYFSESEAELLACGNHTKPKKIPNTPYWVITNTNTQRKSAMLRNIMTAMHFDKAMIKQVCDAL